MCGVFPALPGNRIHARGAVETGLKIAKLEEAKGMLESVSFIAFAIEKNTQG